MTEDQIIQNINTMIREVSYGSIIIKIQKGKIVIVEKTETHKMEDIDKKT